jgi:RNA polymerase sigma-32 factor
VYVRLKWFLRFCSLFFLFFFTERRLKDEPATLEELSDTYDVSRERIRQIEVRAFEKLQAEIRRLATEQRLIAVN